MGRGCGFQRCHAYVELGVLTLHRSKLTLQLRYAGVELQHNGLQELVLALPWGAGGDLV